MFTFINSLTLTAAFGSFLLGIVIFIKDPKKLLNITFSVFSFVSVLWIMTNFSFSYYQNIYILQTQYALGALIMPIALIWVYILVDDRISSTKFSLISLVASIACFSAYLQPYFISDLTISGGQPNIVAGPLFDYYSIFILGIFVFFLYKLVIGIKKSSGVRKIQLKFILLGSLTFGGISMITSFILPLFNIIPIGPYDAQSSLFFVGFSAYAILKHRLFNLKVIATELLISSIWLLLLVKILLATSVADLLVGTVLFILMLIFGSLLMSSVRKEVESREKIELLAADLQKANDRLTDLNREKSEFVSFATHQLRAPLTAMKGYGSLILEGDMGPVSKEVRSAVQRVYDSTVTMVSIVDDYLNISRIELGTMKYHFDMVDLRELVSDVIAELKPTIDKAPVKFSYKINEGESDFRVTADKDKLKQVIVNVIDNSMKYTPSGEIKVTVSYDKPRHVLVFKVADTGIGIAPETIPRLFMKFSRANNANKTNIRGTGLGLYVASEIVKAHHGTIKVESPGEGKGTTFTVELEPMAKA